MQREICAIGFSENGTERLTNQIHNGLQQKCNINFICIYHTWFVNTQKYSTMKRVNHSS